MTSPFGIVQHVLRQTRRLQFVGATQRRFSPNFVAALLIFYSINGLALQVKSVAVESQFMRFPEMSVDDMDYQSMNFEYSVDGHVGILNAEVLSRSLECDSMTVTHDYLSVDFTGPEILLRVTDKHANRVVFMRKIHTSGTEIYGDKGCNAAADINADFEAHRKEWLKSLNDKVLTDAREQMAQYLKSELILSYEKLQFPLFYFVSDDAVMADVNQAFDLASTAFDLNREYGASADAQQQLRAAVQIWERKLDLLTQDQNNYADSFNGRVALRQALHRNLTAAYLFLNEFEKARRNDQLAVANGLSLESSMQTLIAEHQRRYLLSPSVASNAVLMANAYRAGQNSISSIKLVDSGKFSGPKRTLTLN